MITLTINVLSFEAVEDEVEVVVPVAADWVLNLYMSDDVCQHTTRMIELSVADLRLLLSGDSGWDGVGHDES